MARAAVDGNKDALDLFLWKKDVGMVVAKGSSYSSDPVTFLIAVDEGNTGEYNYWYTIILLLLLLLLLLWLILYDCMRCNVRHLNNEYLVDRSHYQGSVNALHLRFV